LRGPLIHHILQHVVLKEIHGFSSTRRFTLFFLYILGAAVEAVTRPRTDYYVLRQGNTTIPNRDEEKHERSANTRMREQKRERWGTYTATELKGKYGPEDQHGPCVKEALIPQLWTKEASYCGPVFFATCSLV
jgi:hypothetical protein